MPASDNLQFSVDDLKTPERLEWVLRQIVAHTQSSVGTVASSLSALSSSALDTSKLVTQLAPLIRAQLQAPGTSPLNLQSLLPTAGQAVLLEDTHANRIVLYPAANYPVGTVFYETDRTVVYAIVSSSGTPVWQYITGMYATTLANKPTDLSGPGNAGFLLWITIQNHVFRWSGSAWAFIDEEGGSIVDRVSSPTATGWQLCDGTATDYLQISAGNIVATAFTTPDENTAPAGVYHTSIGVYSGTINAASSSLTFTGTPATLTGNVSAPTFSGTPDTTGNDGDAGSRAAVGIITDPLLALNPHAHSYTPSGINSAPALTMNSYTPAGAVTGTAAPRNLGVLRYFRR